MMTDVGQHRVSVPDHGTPADGETLLNQMHRTLWRYAAIMALVSVGCPAQLRDGPVSVSELARRCEAHEPTLARLLRTAATTGLLRTAGPGIYALTEAGQVLLDGAELQRMRWTADPEIWNALGELTETVRSGRAPFVQRYGDTYGYLSTRPEVAAVFDAFMVSRSSAAATALAASDAVPATGTVADIGGGRGTFLAALLRAHPGLRGILLDLDRAVGGAREYLTANGVAERCEVMAGDFFKGVPSGADVYLLGNVIHNWYDREATEILRVIRSAVPKHGRLLLVEMVLSDDDRPHIGKDLDIRMLTIHPGKERSLAEYSALLVSAGFRIDSVTDLAGPSLISALPVAGGIGSGA